MVASFGVVQPENKIVLTHILPQHEVLLVTKLSMSSSMCLCNVRVELSNFSTADLVEVETVQEEKLLLVQIDVADQELGQDIV